MLVVGASGGGGGGSMMLLLIIVLVQPDHNNMRIDADENIVPTIHQYFNNIKQDDYEIIIISLKDF